jgi:hypothetical protein
MIILTDLKPETTVKLPWTTHVLVLPCKNTASQSLPGKQPGKAWGRPTTSTDSTQHHLEQQLNDLNPRLGQTAASHNT